MELRDTIRTYRWVSGSYDFVFGPVFHPGRKEAVRIANDRPAQRILEVGVGTGLSLPHFRTDSHITGIDVSAEMLAKAEARVQRENLKHVDGLHLMDAEHLGFPDESFDVVVAQYVITTVPNPEATLDEFARVLKPGGEIILVSRVGAEAGMRKALEKWFAPAARKLGWRTEFSWQRYTQWANGHPTVDIVERRAMPPFGHFSLIRFGKQGGAPARHIDQPQIRAAG